MFTHQGHVSKLSHPGTSPGFCDITNPCKALRGAGGGVRCAVEAHESAGVFLSHVGAMLSDS